MGQKTSTCKARRFSDQMQCACGLSWDINDSEPPECPRSVNGNVALDKIREELSAPDGARLALLDFPELPLAHLPAYGIRPGMYSVTWPSQPEFSLVFVKRISTGNGRDYLFFNKAGEPLAEVSVWSDFATRQAVMRSCMVGEKLGEWVAA
jgi:hypothetical protein